DLDGDGAADLLINAEQPPNDGFELLRRPSAYVVFASAIAANTSGILDLNSLTATGGLSLTGEADFNGGELIITVGDLDGVAGDELVVALPSAIGTGSETGKLFVVANADLRAASGNLDWDLAPATKFFQGELSADPVLPIGGAQLLGNLGSDGGAELVFAGNDSIAVIDSARLTASGGGTLLDLDPLRLTTATNAPASFAATDFDADGQSDLLFTLRTDDAGSQAGVIAGSAIAPRLMTPAVTALDGTNFAAGEFVDLVSDGTGGSPAAPNAIAGLEDLDGDGRGEVAFGQFQNSALTAGPIYILRGAALTALTTNELTLSAFDATQGTLLSTVQGQFESLSTELLRAPDLDGDGIREFYLTSNQRAATDPAGRALVILSTDVRSALAGNEETVDLEQLFFNEMP
ncbi:MAG: hypothetical protein AAF648_17290, partial [Pseudomonadota bacterium]